MATLVSRWFGGNNSRNGKAWLAYSIPYYWPCLHVPGFIAALASDLKTFMVPRLNKKQRMTRQSARLMDEIDYVS